jgi:large subunit ribosomal protein L30
MVKSTKKLQVTLIRSPAGRLKSHRATVRGLGLRRLRQSVSMDNSPSVRGMIREVAFLLRVEEM